MLILILLLYELQLALPKMNWWFYELNINEKEQRNVTEKTLWKNLVMVKSVIQIKNGVNNYSCCVACYSNFYGAICRIAYIVNCKCNICFQPATRIVNILYTFNQLSEL